MLNLEVSLPADNLLNKRHVYFVGIKGVGMTALTKLLVEAGVKVSGADVEQDFVTAATLHKLQISVGVFGRTVLPDDTEAVIYSGAHGGAEQPLVAAAKERQLPCYSLAQAVGMLSAARQTIAVCGVGGKSTTSAMVAWILESAGESPSYAIGVGDVPNLGQPARLNPASEWFVIEADEYVADGKSDLTPRFMYLRPQHVICTSLTFDHPDVYQSMSDTKAAFGAFFNMLQNDSWLVVNGDDLDLCQLARKQSSAKVVTVGQQAQNDWIYQVEPLPDSGASRVTLTSTESSPLVFTLPIPGYHNAHNSVLAAVLCIHLGIAPLKVKEALEEWRSVQRRLEYRGELHSGVKVYDDYAHHPRELEAVAKTISEWFSHQPVVVAFEPHTYSRTQKLMDEFVRALSQIPGQILILPIFASAREKKEDYPVTSADLVTALRNIGHNAHFVEDYDQLLQYIQELPAGTVVFTLGAGDIYHTFDHVQLY